jgi:hypothetical protein
MRPTVASETLKPCARSTGPGLAQAKSWRGAVGREGSRGTLLQAIPLGTATGGGVIAVVDERPLRIEDLARRFESCLPDYMAGSS